MRVQGLRKKYWRQGVQNGVEVFRFGASFAGTGNSISVSIYRIVGLVCGTRGQKGKRSAKELYEKPMVKRTAPATACGGAICAGTEW